LEERFAIDIHRARSPIGGFALQLEVRAASTSRELPLNLARKPPMLGTRPVDVSPDNGIAASLSEALLLAVKDLDRLQRERAIEEAAQTADPQGLVDLISTDDAVRRNAALEALTKAGQRSVPALVQALSDPDPEVVMFAASTLGKTLDPSAIPHLARILSHPDVNVCQAAIESLGALRAASTLGALGGLLGRDAWLRFSVVHTLGQIGDPSSAQTLIGLLDDEEVREAVVDALGKVGGIEVIEELVRRLEATAPHREFSLYAGALGNALVRLPDPSVLDELPFWVAFAKRADTTIAPRLIEVLRSPSAQSDETDGLTAVEAAIEIVRCLRLRSCFASLIGAATDERLTEHLLFAAADLGAPLVRHLAAALSHGDSQVRRYACLAIAAAGFEQRADALTSLLGDPHESIRVVVIRLLARLHYTDGIPQIVERLDDESAVVKAAAMEALCRMDAHFVSTALLGNPERLTQKHELVLAIMRANPHPLQRSFLESSLRDPRPEIREAAVAAVAAQRGADLFAALEPLLADASVGVRRAALEALAGNASERIRQLLLGLLESDPDMRRDAIRALGRVGDDRMIPKVIQIFRSCDPEQKAFAVQALSAIGSPSVEPFIAQQLGHRDPRVRRHSVTALVRLGTSSALRRVRVALEDEDERVRLAVVKALASCPHPIARSALERLCLDPVESVAASARAHLGR
jgi:HEAT repeat protein